MPEGSFGITVQLNTGDLQKLQAKLMGTKGRINTGLTARAHSMGALGATMLNDSCPRGEDGNWRRGDPPLSESHEYKYSNPYYTDIFSTAPHAPFIVLGFTPHMPPEDAWLGEGSGYAPRLAVLNNGTPTNPVDYFTPVANELEGVNGEWCARIGDTLWLGG